MEPRRQFAYGSDGSGFRIYEVMKNHNDPMREVASVWESKDANLIVRALNYYYEGEASEGGLASDGRMEAPGISR